MYIHIEIISTSACIFAQEAFFVCLYRIWGYLIDCFLQAVGLVPELASDVDVGGFGPHSEPDHQCPFDQFVGVASHDLSVLAGARLGFIGVDDEVGGSFGGGDFGHEGVFEAGGEAGSSPAPETGELDLVDDPVDSVADNVLGPVPVTLNGKRGTLLSAPEM